MAYGITLKKKKPVGILEGMLAAKESIGVGF